MHLHEEDACELTHAFTPTVSLVQCNYNAMTRSQEYSDSPNVYISFRGVPDGAYYAITVRMTDANLKYPRSSYLFTIRINATLGLLISIDFRG